MFHCVSSSRWRYLFMMKTISCRTCKGHLTAFITVSIWSILLYQFRKSTEILWFYDLIILTFRQTSDIWSLAILTLPTKSVIQNQVLWMCPNCVYEGMTALFRKWNGIEDAFSRSRYWIIFVRLEIGKYLTHPRFRDVWRCLWWRWGGCSSLRPWTLLVESWLCWGGLS